MLPRILLATTLLIPLPLAAQDISPVASPGGVATLVVAAERPAGHDSVSYVLTLAPGVRLFAPRAGTLATRPHHPVRIPFTLGVPATAPAGRVVLATVELRWHGAEVETRELAVVVAPLRAIDFWIGNETITAPAGGTVEIGYRLRNRGNAADTFRVEITTPSTWPSAAIPPRVVVAAGDTAAGVLRVALPATARRGEEHLVRVAVRGTGVREARSARVVIVGAESRFGNLATVPGSIFVGSSSGAAGAVPGVSLTAGGEVRPGTRVSVALRHVDGIAPPAAFRSTLSGPRLRVAADGTGWRARAGDVYTTSDLITGPMNHGRGAEGGFTTGAVSVDAYAAVPWTYHGTREAGHIVRGGARYRTDVGTFGLKAGSVQRQGSLFGRHAQAGATVTYGLRTATHDLYAEAGVIHVADDSAGATGPSVRLRYLVDHGPLSVGARLRTVPATTIRTASHGQEAFLSATYRLTPVLSATAWAFANESSPVSAGAHTASDGASGGFRLGLPNGINGRFSLGYRGTRMLDIDQPAHTTRTVRAGVDVPVIGVILESDLDLGINSGLVDYPFVGARVGARWSGQGQSGWLGLSHHDAGIGNAYTSLDLTATVLWRGARIQGGMNARLNGGDALGSTSFWSAAAIPVLRGTSLAAGVERRAGFLESPWRFSLGLSRSLGVPLPLLRAPVLHGVVFEDRDGDGIRGPGDVTIDGVRVVFGALRTSTGSDGSFRFYDSGRGALSLDPAHLPPGFTIPAGLVLPAHGYVEIPVIRTGGLVVRVFLDREGDGVLADEDSYAEGAVVTVVDGAGLSRDAATNDRGAVRFSGLTPGTYTVLIHRPGADRRPSTPVELEVVIRPGETAERLVAIPLRALEIRRPGGGLIQR